MLLVSGEVLLHACISRLKYFSAILNFNDVSTNFRQFDPSEISHHIQLAHKVLACIYCVFNTHVIVCSVIVFD